MNFLFGTPKQQVPSKGRSNSVPNLFAQLTDTAKSADFVQLPRLATVYEDITELKIKHDEDINVWKDLYQEAIATLQAEKGRRMVLEEKCSLLQKETDRFKEDDVTLVNHSGSLSPSLLSPTVLNGCH
jgi:hypothetical protein